MSDQAAVAPIHSRGIEHLKKNQFRDAAECFSEVLRRQPNHAGAMHFLGVCYNRFSRFEEGLRLMQQSVRLKPQMAEFHHNLGACYRALGRFDEAEQSYRKALELKPNYPEAWFNYSAARKFSDDETSLPIIERMLETKNLSESDREFLHFAAGKICDDRSEYDQAFSHYAEANRLRGHQFDLEEHAELTDKISATFSKEFFERAAEKGLGSDSEEPIFVVGMPRSGSTLVEQILSSHPQIEGAGELRDIIVVTNSLPRHAGNVPYPECMGSLPDEAYEGFANHYLKQRLPLRKAETLRIVDKMPGNFLHVGLIRCLFPRARVIHSVRDPRDTCLSCFFHRFRTGHHYSGDLRDVAYYYRLHERSMNYWKDTMPGMIHTLNYQYLIDSPEETTRELLEFCGVEWDEACLRFHENKRAVTTASNYQVRKPLNRQGLERWKRYEANIGPLVEALEEFAPLARY